MLTENRLKAAIAQGRLALGLLGSVPSPLLVEMLGYAGYDFVILDQEHVGVNPETLENMIRAAECSGLTALVRVPSAAPDGILRALDAGAQGVVIPRVRSRQEAEAAVRAARYHPLGSRGISGGRTTGFGRIPLADYLERANREVMVVVMIEDREAVEAIDSIVSVPGVDLVLEGAIDLSQSYGVPARFDHPEVQQAIRRIAESCRRHRVPFCAIPRLPGQAEAWSRDGAAALLLGDDRGVAFRALKAHVSTVREELSGKPEGPSTS
jgi:4-hydroxy-2-oxoheptanedioate aldolase